MSFLYYYIYSENQLKIFFVFFPLFLLFQIYYFLLHYSDYSFPLSTPTSSFILLSFVLSCFVAISQKPVFCLFVFVMRERKGVGLEERKGGMMVLLLENCPFILIHCGICKTLELESTEPMKPQTGWWDEPFPPLWQEI